MVQAAAGCGTGIWRRRRARICRWQPEGRHHEHEGGLPSKERRSLQRERRTHRVLQSPRRTEWRSVDYGHERDRRPEISESAVSAEYLVQERARRLEVASDAL